MPDDEGIALHPSAANLREACRLLAEEVGRLLADIEHLLHVQRPHLEARYMVEVGYLEVDLFTLEIANRRLRREIELIQAALNRGEAADPRAIREALDEELREWQLKVEDVCRKLESARTYMNGEPVENWKAIKATYRKLVLALHPDLHPDLGEDALRLWHRVQRAYQHADLEELESLLLLAGQGASADPLAGVSDLEREKAALTRHVDQLLARIEEIYAGHPFNIEEKLDDPFWVDARRAEIGLRLQSERERQTRFRAMRTALLGEATA